jgi:hypothetical protein
MEDGMKKTLTDAADVTPKTLFGIDSGWYETYWYGSRPDPNPHLLGRVAHQLANVIGATRARRFGWAVRQNVPATVQHRAQDLITAGEG